MNKWFIISALVLLTGCSSPHLIVLLDGSEIATLDQPSYNRTTGFFEFEAINGKDRTINRDQVKTIIEL